MDTDDRETLRAYHNLMAQAGKHQSAYRRAAGELRESFSNEMEKELERRNRLAACADTLVNDIAASDAGLDVNTAYYVSNRLKAWARGETPPTPQDDAATASKAA